MRTGEMAAVLRSSAVRRLWLAQLASHLGDWAARLALTVLIYERTHSAALAGLVTAVSLLPWVGIGQVLASYGDRLPRRRVVVVSDLVRAALFAAMVLPVPSAVILVLAFLAGCATPPFNAARSALVRAVTDESSYGPFIRLDSLTKQVAVIAGYLAGGGLVTVVGAGTALLVNAATFLVSALLIVGIAEPRVTAAAAKASTRLRQAAAVIVADRSIMRALVLTMAAMFTGMAGEALVAVYAAAQLHAGAGLAGVLAACIAVGTIVTFLVVPATGSDERLLRVGSVVAGVGAVVTTVGLLVPGGVMTAVVAFLGLGIVFGVALPTNVVVGTRLPDHIRASAFGLLEGALMVAQLAGAGLTGVLAGVVGIRPACAIAVVPMVAATVVVLLTRRAEPAPAVIDLTVVPAQREPVEEIAAV